MALLLATILATGCTEKKQDKAEEAATETIEDAEEAIDKAGAKIDSTGERLGDKLEDAIDKESITITGKVLAINNGKDGYTATIEGAGGKKYDATISIPNLDNPKQYRTVKTGEEITVSGEVVQAGETTIIKVEELK